METDLSIFTFTSKKGNVHDGKYSFIANHKRIAIGMALAFETEHNKFNKQVTLSFDLNNPSSMKIKRGFIAKDFSLMLCFE